MKIKHPMPKIEIHKMKFYSMNKLMDSFAFDFKIFTDDILKAW